MRLRLLITQMWGIILNAGLVGPDGSFTPADKKIVEVKLSLDPVSVSSLEVCHYNEGFDLE